MLYKAERKPCHGPVRRADGRFGSRLHSARERKSTEMNTKSAIEATLLVVFLAVAVGIADGFFAFKEKGYSSFSKRSIGSTGSTNIIQQFFGDWYVAFFNNYDDDTNPMNPENACYREIYVIDPILGSLTIAGNTYKVSDGALNNTCIEIWDKVNRDPATNTVWRYAGKDGVLTLQKITKEFGVYTYTFEDGIEASLSVLTKNAVITEKQLADAKEIAKKVGFDGDELNRNYNTHCGKLLPPL